MEKVLIIFLVTVMLIIIDSARILVVLPTPSQIHNLMYRIVYKELSRRGHELVVFTSHPLNDRHLTNIREIDLTPLHKYAQKADMENSPKSSRIAIVAGIQKDLLNITKKIFLHPEMQTLLHDPMEKFDLLMIEWCVNPSFAALSKRFNCPMIGMRCLDLQLEGHDSVGNPTNPSYIPVAYMNFENNFWGRLDNFLFSIIWRLHHHWVVVPEAQRIANNFVPNYTGNVLDTEKDVSIILANTHPLYSWIRPLVPAVIEIGGIHLIDEKQDIPEDIKNFLDDSKEGVIYLSFGIFVHSTYLDSHILKIIIRALADGSYKILWKCEKDTMENPPNNFKISKWLPQTEVLGHPNVKAFITPADLMSLIESIDKQVPLVVISLFADQHVNARRIEDLKIGKRLDINTLQKNVILQTIQDVINNPMYKKNIIRASQILHDVPVKPLDKAIWWIEYVLRHKGARHLKSLTVDETWSSYLLLDVIGFILVTCIISLICLNRIIRKTLRRKVYKEKIQ